MSELLVRGTAQELPEGAFLATSYELPGFVAQGRTLVETLDLARDVARVLTESYAAHGDPFHRTFAHSGAAITSSSSRSRSANVGRWSGFSWNEAARIEGDGFHDL